MQVFSRRLAGILVALFLCISAGFAASDDNSNATPAYYWGLFGDYNYTMHSTTNDGFTILNWDKNGTLLSPAIGYPYFEDGKGQGFSIGGLFEWNWKPGIQFGVSLGYSLMKGKFYDDVCAFNIPDEAGGYFDVIGTRHYFKPDYSTINLMPYIQANIYKGLYGKFGLNFGEIISNSAKEYEVIKYSDPEGAFWADTKGTESTKNDIDMDDEINKFQFGVTLGLGYEIPLNSKGMILVPEVKFNLGLTKIASDLPYNAAGKKCDWGANTLSFGLGLKMPVYKNTEEEEVETVATKNELGAELNIYGVNSDGKRIANPTIKIEEFETEEVFPLLTSVYFTPGKSTMNDTRMNQLSDIQVSNFREEDLAPNSVELNHDIVNLIAYRMYDNTSATIVLTGYANPDGEDAVNPNIASERVNAVKNYLIQNWGISPNRIGVKTGTVVKRNTSSTKDYSEENAKVTIAPADEGSQSLFTPLNKIFIDKVANPPMAEFKTKINADAGVDNYQLIVSQNGKDIKKFNGVAAEDATLWTIDNVKFADPIDVTLIAKDKVGQKAQTDKNMNIDIVTMKQKRERREGDYKVTRYSLILFDFDKSEISANDQYTVKMIKKEITSDSKVVISGYADRTGASQYNKTLSQKRCQEVKKALGVSNAELKPYGNDILLFDNTTPEGRALSRTVRVEILSPVK